MRQFFSVLFATFIILLYTISSTLLALAVIIFGGLARLIPNKSGYQILIKIALNIAVMWVSVSNGALRLRRHRWKIEGEGNLTTHCWYLLISNHQTWLDILVLGYVFNRKTPLIRFFMKKELVWGLPILGLSCWILGYPFLHRYDRKDIRKRPKLKNKDIQITKTACKKFKEFPTTIMNFVEGTRFTTEKHRRQQSPFLHLLKPKVGSLAVVINELKNELSGILDVTIHYSQPMSFWKYFSGDYANITIHYKLLPLTADLIGNYYDDREFRCYLQKWLNSVWVGKDLLLDKLSYRYDEETQTNNYCS
ncbi:MAG: acetyltransferase [Coxiella-like endosymbiont]|uniref:acetyltransferase n=1 Tax=Coxiella-like endosymbiont TaxID=1592897 RepID=UPI00215A2B3E|nr:acetyltransferase [Coxiella-like endosymbiont]UVE59425.1 1-acyl-sn-glycerol-3-phosphate acyltransferase [Coxiella-like endosymbiont]